MSSSLDASSSEPPSMLLPANILPALLLPANTPSPFIFLAYLISASTLHSFVLVICGVCQVESQQQHPDPFALVTELGLMVRLCRPSESAPGSIRGDFCIDVGRNICMPPTSLFLALFPFKACLLPQHPSFSAL